MGNDSEFIVSHDYHIEKDCQVKGILMLFKNVKLWCSPHKWSWNLLQTILECRDLMPSWHFVARKSNKFQQVNCPLPDIGVTVYTKVWMRHEGDFLSLKFSMSGHFYYLYFILHWGYWLPFLNGITYLRCGEYLLVYSTHRSASDIYLY